MVKTSDKAVLGIENYLNKFVDAGTPRETFGIEGYKKFIRESWGVSDKRVLNKMKYGSLVQRVQDSSYERKNKFENLDLKRDRALYNIEKVDVLHGEAKQHLGKLDELVSNYDIMVFNSKPKVLENRAELNSLKEEYTKLDSKYSIVKDESLSKVDKIKNVFYSIFNKSKIKKDTETFEGMKNRIALGNEVNSLKNEIKYKSKVLKNDEKEFSGFKKNLRSARREVSKVNEFLNESGNIQDFYQSYIDDSGGRFASEREVNQEIPFEVEGRRGISD